MPDIGERMLELAKESIGDQERQVADLRTRGATVLAAGGVVGGLFGDAVFDGGHPDGPVEWGSIVVALVAATGLLVSVVDLYRPRRFAFSFDARQVYTELFRQGITEQPRLDLELAYRLATTREENVSAVDRVSSRFRTALGSFLLLLVALAVAAALAS